MVTVTSPSDFAPASSKEFLDIQATVECGFTLKRVRDMTRTYSQMHRTDKYSEHSSIMASLAKWLSVCLRTKWFWVRVQLQSFISVLHFSNRAQFLNTTCVIAPRAISPVSAAFLLLAVIFPVTKIYASE